MQNNEPNKQFGKLRQVLKEKGYYIVLSLCIVAVGISGYVFVTSTMEQNQAVEETLSVPVTVDESAQQTKPSGNKTDSTKTTEEDNTQTTPSQSGKQDTAATSATVELPQEDAVPTVGEQAVRPVSGSVVHDYAMDRLTYNATTRDWRVHHGVDLAAAEGQGVAAAKSGTVTAVYDDPYYGTTVVIRHDDGYTTHYCNLTAEPAVSAGDTVSAGQIIGTVGATALMEVSTEPHLHFEVYYDGEPVDPAELLS